MLPAEGFGITDSEEPPGQAVTETLHTLQALLLKLMRHEELVFSRQNVGLSVLRKALIEARSSREVLFEELVRNPWMEKGKTAETMSNYFDMKTRYVGEYVDGVVARIKRDLEAEQNKLARLSANNLFKNRSLLAVRALSSQSHSLDITPSAPRSSQFLSGNLG